MKMKSCLLLLLYFGLTCCRGVYAENERDIKRGAFPYMAFIYYSDPSVVDATGQRFIRSAVLIKPDWLATSALIIDQSFGFPKKTLLARVGAIGIDDKFTLNEDEDEQEREIVQIMRPYNHSATQWWTTDISLVKTLFPFNITPAVDIHNLLRLKPDAEYKSCSILVYARKSGNLTEDKMLMVLYVELLPPSIENCGSHFAGSTMTCAIDSEDNKHAVYDMDFCDGNSGGPLVCDNDVIGLQTYIGDNCKQPHLYQLIHAWNNFINCAIEDKCQEGHCMQICEANYKDSPNNNTNVTLPVTHDLASDAVELIITPSPINSSGSTVMVNVNEFSSTASIPIASVVPDDLDTSEIFSAVPESSSSMSTPIDNFYTIETEEPLPQDKSIEESLPQDKSTEEPWPKEKDTSWPKDIATTLTTDTEKIKPQERELNMPQETETARPQEITRSQETETPWPKENETSRPKDNETYLATERTSPNEKDAKETKLPWLGGDPNVRAWPKKKDSVGYRDDDAENSERPTRVEAQQHEKDKKKASATNRSTCGIQTLLFAFIVLLCL